MHDLARMKKINVSTICITLFPVTLFLKRDHGNKFQEFFGRRFASLPLVLLQKEEIESGGRLSVLETVLQCAPGAWTSIQPPKCVPSLNRSAGPFRVATNTSNVNPDDGVSVGFGVFSRPLTLVIRLLLQLPVDQVLVGKNTALDVLLDVVSTSARTLEPPTMAQQRFLNGYNQL